VALSPEVEDAISRSIQHSEYESYAIVDPDIIQRLAAGLNKYIHHFTIKGIQPVILCSPQIRAHFRRLMERFFPNIAVVSHNELTREVNIKSIGMVEL